MILDSSHFKLQRMNDSSHQISDSFTSIPYISKIILQREDMSLSLFSTNPGSLSLVYDDIVQCHGNETVM